MSGSGLATVMAVVFTRLAGDCAASAQALHHRLRTAFGLRRGTLNLLLVLEGIKRESRQNPVEGG